MTTAEYMQRGETLDYKNTTDETIPHNVIIVVGDHIGVTGFPILPGKTGSLHMGGVFEIPKTGTAEIEMGQTVYFDGEGITDAADDGAADPTAYTKAGYAAAPTAANSDKILVKLCG